MGACQAISKKGTPKEQSSNAEITNKMKAEINNQEYTHRILLLGPGESGKTTILKQMRKIYGSDTLTFAVKENRLCDYIKENVMRYVKILCEQSIKLNISLNSSENENYRQYFANEISPPYVEHLNIDIGKQIESLWSDSGIKQTLFRRSEFQIPDNVEYFMDKIEEIASDTYHVTFDDYVRIRMKTTGFTTETFKKQLNNTEHSFAFTDVGGQRSERKKWINMIHDDIDVVVYVVAISEYDLLCHEDENTLRLTEALNLFKSILCHGYGKGKTVTLFFNKYDLFLEKIADVNQKSIAEMYSDFPSNKDARN
eukprot:470733_1